MNSNIELNQRRINKLQECRELMEDFKPEWGRKSDVEIIEFALAAYAIYLKEEIKLRDLI